MTTANKSEKDRVVIFDTTLRDGEQCPGATMTHEEKLEVAELLDDVGEHAVVALPVITIGRRVGLVVHAEVGEHVALAREAGIEIKRGIVKAQEQAHHDVAILGMKWTAHQPRTQHRHDRDGEQRRSNHRERLCERERMEELAFLAREREESGRHKGRRRPSPSKARQSLTAPA